MRFALCALLVAVVSAKPSFFGYQPPPDRRGVTAVGPANGLCAGVDDDSSTVAAKSRVYVAQCNGTFSTTRAGTNSYSASFGYLQMQVDYTALIRGADAAYISSPSSCSTNNDASSCNSANNILLFEAAGGAATAYQSTSANESAGSATYAYASTGAYFGKAGLPSSENGFYAGTATYLATSGTISTNTNSFNIAGTSKDACISTIANNACGTARTFATGAYKFSLFGYTIENTANAINGTIMNTPGGQFNYLGFRQRITLGGSPSSATTTYTITKTAGGTVDLDTVAGEDASGFQLCVDSQCLDYTFPTAYNYGSLVSGQASVTGGVTGSLKIKISKPASSTCTKCAYVDYLFPLTGLNAGDKWFVYDPDVTASSPTPSPSPSSTTSGASNISPWALGNSLVCIATLMAWW